MQPPPPDRCGTEPATDAAADESVPLAELVARAPERCRLAWEGARRGQRVSEAGRAPTLGLYPGLRASPFWDSELAAGAGLSGWLTALQSHTEVFRRELAGLRAAAGLEPLRAAVAAGGRWHAGYLQREGQAQDCTRQGGLCAESWQALLRIGVPLLHGCALGFVYFSEMQPGTLIQAHYGPSNVRLRVHLALEVPAGPCWLEVAGRRVAWQPGRTLIFDDSYQHAAACGPDASGPRAVLLLDVWHPDLLPIERRILCRALPAPNTAARSDLE